MKHLFYVIILFFITSCSNQKIIQLPEITNSKVHEVLDVSPAYIFYNKNKPDSLELNRKNLISTTNWLVNIDKRLTLKQVIPKIVFLQEKKRNSSHKKEGVKNYYTCNDTSIKNLGFIEFTSTNYILKDSLNANKFNTLWKKNKLEVYVKSLTEIQLISVSLNSVVVETNLEMLHSELKNLQLNDTANLVLNFKKTLTFQDYITFKSLIKELNLAKFTINNNEFIY